jgi:hypothetical protein
MSQLLPVMPNVEVKPQRVWALPGLDDPLNFSLAEAYEPIEPPACNPTHPRTWSTLQAMVSVCRYPTPFALQQTASCRSFLPPELG